MNRSKMRKERGAPDDAELCRDVPESSRVGQFKPQKEVLDERIAANAVCTKATQPDQSQLESLATLFHSKLPLDYFR